MTDDPSARLRQLTAELETHNRAYYAEASPTISDAEYDLLFRELEQLEAANPDLADPNSPTQRVGGAPIDGFQSATHELPMLSIDDLFSQGELADWWKRLQRLCELDEPLVTIEPKIDGVAISLLYEAGELSRALTRGDGQRGDDITINARTIRNLPLSLKPKTSSSSSVPVRLEVRGEVYQPFAEFAALNEAREEAGQERFANPRNATAGALKRLDPKEVARYPLRFLAHGRGAWDGPEPADDSQFQQLLEDLSIPKNHPQLEAHNLEQLSEAIAEIDRLRHDLPFATDGAVVKLADYALRARLGNTSRAPRWACAFKFPPEQVETKLHSISVQVGRTGKLTPVAELEPVLVSGSTVARATLHNQDEIERKDVRPGDTVIIEKAGEIIPAIVRVVLEKRPEGTKPYSLPQALNYQCPSCGGPIEREEDAVAWHCINFACPAQAVTRIAHFASRKALDVDALGKLVAEALVRSDLAHTPLELFQLDLDTLAKLNLGSVEAPRRFGEKNATRLLAGLDQARHEMPLHRWLFAFGIPHVGESSAREVARLHPDLKTTYHSQLLHDIACADELEARRLELSRQKRDKDRPQAELEELSEAHNQLKDQVAALHASLEPQQLSADLGPVAARSLTTFFDSAAGKRVIETLEALSINPQSEQYRDPSEASSTADLPLAGLTFVLTGTLSIGRREMADLLEAAGAKVSGSISKNTNYLLAGEGAGSKASKAESLGVSVIDEAHARQLISQGK